MWLAYATFFRRFNNGVEEARLFPQCRQLPESVNKAEPPPDLAHLRGLFLALGILLAAIYPAIAGMEKLVRAAEEKSVSQPLKQKNQGLALMEAAFRRADVLPVFGSSELVMDRENRAASFFQNAPTDQ